MADPKLPEMLSVTVAKTVFLMIEIVMTQDHYKEHFNARSHHNITTEEMVFFMTLTEPTCKFLWLLGIFVNVRQVSALIPFEDQRPAKNVLKVNILFFLLKIHAQVVLQVKWLQRERRD